MFSSPTAKMFLAVFAAIIAANLVGKFVPLASGK